MLRFPAKWIPKVALDDDKVEQAVQSYQWTSAGSLFRWVEKACLAMVGTYLVHHYTVPYWDIILEGGVRGYSLYLHEFTELKWYEAQHLNPFDSRIQILHYAKAHSLGLLVEHRLLQVVARTMGYDFSLRELILGNPHGDPPQQDWQDVRTHRQHEVSQADDTYNPAHEPQVEEFYRRLGFRKVT